MSWYKKIRTAAGEGSQSTPTSPGGSGSSSDSSSFNNMNDGTSTVNTNTGYQNNIQEAIEKHETLKSIYLTEFESAWNKYEPTIPTEGFLAFFNDLSQMVFPNYAQSVISEISPLTNEQLAISLKQYVDNVTMEDWRSAQQKYVENDEWKTPRSAKDWAQSYLMGFMNNVEGIIGGLNQGDQGEYL
jgi:hypothetical protein